MKTYTLYNKKLDRRLVHPRVGLWFTPDLEEAQEMLEACKEYLSAIHAGSEAEHFVIIDVESGQEV